MKTILKMTREVYQNFYDYHGNMHDKPIGSITRMNLSEERIDFLRRYITFILESDFISDISKIYIRTNLISSSVAAVIEYYNKTHPEEKEIKIKAAQSSTDYASNKLIKYFGDRMLTQIIHYKECSLEHYTKQLNLAIAEYSRNKWLSDNLILKLHHVDVKDSCPDEAFTELMSIIAPYFKKRIKYVENNLPESVGYLLYLMSAPVTSLSFEDKQRYEIIKGMME